MVTLFWMMRWSKNILEERHLPSQIILGSNDPFFLPASCRTLACDGAVLCACFDSWSNQLVPPKTISRVQGQCKWAHILDPTANPTWNVGLAVCGHECQLFINDLVLERESVKGAEDNETCASKATNTTPSDLNLKRKRHSFELHIILSQLAILRKQNEVFEYRIWHDENPSKQKVEIHIRHYASFCSSSCYII